MTGSSPNWLSFTGHICEDNEGWSIADFYHYTFESSFQPIFNAKLNVIGFEALARVRVGADHYLDTEAFFNSYPIESKELLMINLLCQDIHISNFASLYPHNRTLKLYLNTCSEALKYNVGSQRSIYRKHKHDNDFNPEQIVYELSEREVDNISEQKSAVKDIRISHSRIALDDVTDLDSIEERLIHLSPEYIKLDKSLVKNLDHTRQSIERIVARCDSIGCQIIAEGIETQEQFSVLTSLNLFGYQGFYFSRPMKPQQLVWQPLKCLLFNHNE